MKYLGVLALILVLVAVVCYAAGWIKFESEPESATIEIKTEQMEQAAERAVERGKEIVDDAAKAVDSTIEDWRPTQSPEPPAKETTEIEIVVPPADSRPDPET